MAWNPEDVDYFTLIGNIIIIVQYIQDRWMINIHTMERMLTRKLIWKYCKICIFLYILKSKFNCLCFGWKYGRLILESSGPPRSKIGGHIVYVLFVILSFCPLWNINLANYLWTVSARAIIFHMNIPCDKTFPWVQLFLTLWPLPWSLTYFLKTLTLLKTFEQWVL